jgi:hypothetical protein
MPQWDLEPPGTPAGAAPAAATPAPADGRDQK